MENNNKRTGSPLTSSSPSSSAKYNKQEEEITNNDNNNNNNNNNNENQLKRKFELTSFINSLNQSEGCTPAWSCTNLLAIPTPILSPSPSILGLPYQHPSPPLLSVTLTHFTGTTSLNHSNTSSSSNNPSEKEKGKGKLKSRLSFSLILPPCPPQSRITRLSFAPCGGHLLVNTTVEGGSESDIVTVFEQKSGCINEWHLCWHEKINSFGSREGIGSESKRVIDLRWLGEPRKWYPKRSDEAMEDDSQSIKPLFCAPHRSPPVVGSAFLLVLSSDELLFVHLPRSLPLLPMLLVIPLSDNVSARAQPTPPTNPTATSPGTSLKDHVTKSNYVIIGGSIKNTSASPASSSNGTVGRKNSTTGVGKLIGNLASPFTASSKIEEEVKLSELNKSVARKRIVKAAMGMVRGNQSADWGRTTFLIATCSVPISSPSPPPTPLVSSSESEPLNLSIPPISIPPSSLTALAAINPTSDSSLLINSPDLGDFDSMDFNGLDEAFGDPLPPPAISGSGLLEGMKNKKKVLKGERGGKLEGGKRSGERKIDLCELVVELTAQGGPKLTLKSLSSLHISDPTLLGSSVKGVLTHLDWLEDIELPTEGAEEGSESTCDLHLLAVLASPDEEGGYHSTLTTWALSNEAYTFSEAFAGLECKKLDLTRGTPEWAGRRLATQIIKDLITFVVPRLGPVFSSFIVGKHTFDSDTISTKISALNSSTLEPLEGFIPTSLPGGRLYGKAQISPNRGLLCALPYPYNVQSQPGLVAVPLAREGKLLKTLGDHLAIAIARQVDASDLVGRVLGLRDEASTIDIVRNIRDTLQAMLPKARSFEGSTLQVEFMGIVSSLYNSFPGLQLRGSIAFNIIELAACARVFLKCEKRERTMPEKSYRCESDAVWPLIGHVKWYTEFCRELVKEVQESGPVASSPRLLLILQPYTRGLLIRISEYALALQAFLASFPVNANVTVDLARSVLDDTINYNGLVIREWRKLLIEFGQSQIVELSGEKPQTLDLLIDFTIPPSFLPACTQIFQHLSNPNLIITLPPTPPTSPSASSHTLDVIRKGKLPQVGSFRMCTRCGERSEITEREGTETGRWQAYELGWEVRCMCSGLWYAV